MADGIYAVLIADIIASTARRDVRALLGKKLAAASEKHLRQKLIRLPYSVTAGDEFQTITAELPAVPALILDLRSAAASVSAHRSRHRRRFRPHSTARQSTHRRGV